jgi:hypothetical protein
MAARDEPAPPIEEAMTMKSDTSKSKASSGGNGRTPAITVAKQSATKKVARQVVRLKSALKACRFATSGE